jgi:ankyrin repeat protein
VLVRAGARLDATAGADGSTVLHVAASSGSWDSVSALLASGADPAARDVRGRAPADVAMARGHRTLAHVLALVAAHATGQAPPHESGWF